jgi:glucose-6-phosphate isomerase
MSKMTDHPFGFTLPIPAGIPSRYDNHLKRGLSALEGLFQDEQARTARLSRGDAMVYEVYEIAGPQLAGELLMGVTVIHPGKVGREFYMTKGHFHSVRETAEVYFCLKGEGMMVMETLEGETAVEPLTPGKVLYVAPCWGHRSVCTSRQDDLVMFFAYPGNAGHDYETVAKRGFRKLVVDGEDGPEIIDNPHWSAS